MAQTTKSPPTFDVGVPSDPNAEGLWECPVCTDPARTFTLQRGLVRHLNESHGANVSGAINPTDAERKAAGLRSRNDAAKERREIEQASTSAIAAIRDELTDLVVPLRAKLREIDRRIEVVMAEAAALRSARSDVEGVLRRLDPTFAPQSKMTPAQNDVNALRKERQDAERVTAIRTYLETHGDGDGFTVTQIAERVKAAGGPPMTSATGKRALELLREQGILRLDRIVRGGGQSYKLVGGKANGNGHG